MINLKSDAKNAKERGDRKKRTSGYAVCFASFAFPCVPCVTPGPFA
jgi:hypothetical protein